MGQNSFLISRVRKILPAGGKFTQILFLKELLSTWICFEWSLCSTELLLLNICWICSPRDHFWRCRPLTTKWMTKARCKVVPQRSKLWNITPCATRLSFSVACAKFSVECKNLSVVCKNVNVVFEAVGDKVNLNCAKSRTYQTCCFYFFTNLNTALTWVQFVQNITKYWHIWSFHILPGWKLSE